MHDYGALILRAFRVHMRNPDEKIESPDFLVASRIPGGGTIYRAVVNGRYLNDSKCRREIRARDVDYGDAQRVRGIDPMKGFEADFIPLRTLTENETAR